MPRHAKGVAILTVYKAGFGVSGRGGTGVVVARTGKGWSGPSSIGTGGAGFGFQIGASETEFIYILNTREAVEAFAHGGNVQFGGDISVAAGPVGRTAEGAVTPVAAVYAYSRSQGLFAGVSLQGTVIAAKDETNAEYRPAGHTGTNPLREGQSAGGGEEASKGTGEVLKPTCLQNTGKDVK